MSSRFLAPKNRNSQEHRGRLDRVVFCDPNQPFVILLLDDGATVIGSAQAEQFTKGVIYRFFGTWTDDERRGPRFRFSTFVVHAAHSKAGVTKYLCQTCTGVGERTADRLWQRYGGEAVELLRADPARVAAECDLAPDVCTRAAAELEQAKRYEATRIDLFTLTAGRGFSGALIERAIEKWGVHAPRTIRRNPFALLGLPSAGFKRCDRLWTDLGLSPGSPKRAATLATHIVKSDPSGHTWVSAADLADRLREAAPGCDVRRSLQLAIRARKLKKHKDDTGTLWLGTYHRATSEERIAAAVGRLTAYPSLWPADRVPVSAAAGDRLPSAHQVERLRRAARRPVGLFLGGPGTGKSHSLAYLLREVIAEFGRSSVAVAAPTGKAAVRATQALALAGLDVGASTIHRLLEIGRNGHDGDGWGFLRNRANPLDAKFLVVDESSMIDADLMADLLDAVPAGGQVLFVGDPYQLPPVGHGAPLRDLIDAGVPHGELTEVRRNAGQIVHACVRIKNGESFDAAEMIDLDADPPRNLKLVEARDEAHQVEQLLDVVKRMTRFHPVWQTQVIVARNAKGGISRKRLNEVLHPLLNPDGYGCRDNPFKVGDKVICLKNSRMHRAELFGRGGGEAAERDAANYETVRDEAGQPEEVYVANGEIGRVVAVAPRLTVARFSEGEALVKIPMGRQRDQDEEGGEDDGGGGRGCNFDHAYAVTCHKMQGSESPCVVVLADAQAAQLCERAWWYTAISRASKLCVLIGQKGTIDAQRLRQSLVRRKTFLKERVQQTLWEGL